MAAFQVGNVSSRSASACANSPRSTRISDTLMLCERRVDGIAQLQRCVAPVFVIFDGLVPPALEAANGAQVRQLHGLPHEISGAPVGFERTLVEWLRVVIASHRGGPSQHEIGRPERVVVTDRFRLLHCAARPPNGVVGSPFDLEDGRRPRARLGGYSCGLGRFHRLHDLARARGEPKRLPISAKPFVHLGGSQQQIALARAHRRAQGVLQRRTPRTISRTRPHVAMIRPALRVPLQPRGPRRSRGGERRRARASTGRPLRRAHTRVGRAWPRPMHTATLADIRPPPGNATRECPPLPPADPSPLPCARRRRRAVVDVAL